MNPAMEPLHPIQRAALQRMSPAEKWNISLGLLETATQSRLVALRLAHPDWAEDRLQAELAMERRRGEP
ncbi:MAG: hypothetical protein EBV83_03230 [Verrucomicrobia bacterium]|nr:hypothetical protein [Verrucomicrobiota bacterium]